MRCIAPIKAGYGHDLTSIVYSTKKATKELLGFEFECRKCLPCRLNQAREKSIRAWHETKTVDDSIFFTATYNEESLLSPKLIYADWQQFMKDLRNHLQYHDPDRKIRAMVTGEYGDKNKRPHWHAIIFNYRPEDQPLRPTRHTELGHPTYVSPLLDKLWGRGNTEYGEVSIESAGYVARYAAKKLTHGRDQDHDYHPVHKTPQGRGLGRTWIEQNWLHTFENGFVVLPNGQKSKIPRYYVDWAKIHHPSLWEYYVTEIRPRIMLEANENARKEEILYWQSFHDNVRVYNSKPPLTRSKIKETILKAKFKILQEKLKL